MRAVMRTMGMRRIRMTMRPPPRVRRQLLKSRRVPQKRRERQDLVTMELLAMELLAMELVAMELVTMKLVTMELVRIEMGPMLQLQAHRLVALRVPGKRVSLLLWPRWHLELLELWRRFNRMVVKGNTMYKIVYKKYCVLELSISLSCGE
jgi:hypothetical protein